MKIVTALACLAGLVACATPGIDYTARLPAGAPAAAEYRDVTVGGFSGPAGGWFSSEFEEMLYNATLDGLPWFYVNAGRAQPGVLSGLYSGYISVDDVIENVYEETVRKCVEWDGPFDCETRADVLQTCVDTEVVVSVYPELIDRKTGEIVFAGRYSGSASDSDCVDAHDYSPRYGRYHDDDLIREALEETLPQIRNDVAPRNGRVRATLVADAMDPVARADPRFEQAVEGAKSGDVLNACAIWDVLAEEYPASPGVIHNQGACAEARGDYSAAQQLYAKASELAIPYAGGESDDAVNRINDSLARISSRRSDEVWLDLTDGGEPEPYREAPES